MDIEISTPAFDTLYNKLIYAIRPEYREIVAKFPFLIHFLKDNEENEKNRYKCTKCCESVFPKRCPTIRWHFSHYPSSDCTNDEVLKLGGESDTHKFAKYVLFGLLNEKIPMTLLGSVCSTRDCDKTLAAVDIVYNQGDEIKLEYQLSDSPNKADVAVVNNGIIRYVFEVFHTSKTKTPRPDPWFEIKASDILDNTQQPFVTIKDVKPYLCGACPQKDINKIVMVPSICNDQNVSTTLTKSSNSFVSVQLYKDWTTKKIANYLGYVDDHKPYACEAQRLVDMAMRGSYELACEIWDTVGVDYKDECNFEGFPDTDKYIGTNLWKEFLSRGVCMRCEKYHNAQWGKPLCMRCYRLTKKEQEDGTIVKRIEIADAQKNNLREKLNWLACVPGGWTSGESCTYCKQDYREPGSNYVKGYVWWFGDRKKCCIVCLEKICKSHGIL